MKPDKTGSLLEKINYGPFEVVSSILELSAEVPTKEVALDEFDVTYCDGKKVDADVYCSGKLSCKAFRMIISGKPISDDEYNRYKAGLSESSIKSITANSIPDMDGDNLPDQIEEVAVVPLELKKAPSTNFCKQPDDKWDVVEVSPRTFTYLFSMSGGKRAFVSATVYFYEPKRGPEEK